MRRLTMLSVLTAAIICSPMLASAASTVTDNQGIQYLLPYGWQAKLLQRGIQLYPPQASGGEMYIAMRFDWSFTKADRDKVLQVFDAMTAKIGSHFQRTRDGWFNGPQGPIVVIIYEGHDQNGTHQTLRYYFGAMGRTSFCMLAAAETQLLNTRNNDVLKIFLAVVNRQPQQPPVGGNNGGLFGSNNPNNPGNNLGSPNGPSSNIDQQLVGRWVRQVNSNSDAGLGIATSTTTYVFDFQANGTFTLSMSNGSGQTKSVSGRWTASNGALHLTFADGSTLNLSYNIFSYQGTPALKLLMQGKAPAYYLKAGNSNGNGNGNPIGGGIGLSL